MSDLGYQLTIKQIDMDTQYPPLVLCGLSGLGIDKMQHLIESGELPATASGVSGADFLNWVDRNDLPVANQ